MNYAALYYPVISHLVLNDIGPFIPKHSIDGLRDFCNDYPMTSTIEEMADILRAKYSAEYGPKVTLEDWHRMAREGTYFDDKTGKYKLAYDPKVAEGLLL